MGTLIAWVLVRDEFRGKRFVNALIDLPFALPTIVAGLDAARALRAERPDRHQHRLHARRRSLLALLFVTLPFVVRAVQPVLMALEREVEEAAASLGASPLTIFRRIILPALRPAILAGVGLAFGRAVGEFGSVVLISGNMPVQDRGRLGARLRADRERQRHRRRRRVASLLLAISFVRAAGHLVRRAHGGCSDDRRHRACASIALGYLAALLVVPVGMVFYRAFEHGFGAAWDAVTTPPAQHAFYLTLRDRADRGAAATRSSAW